MTLRARDRRTLREIEQHLDAEDPALARLLDESPKRPGATTRIVARLSWAVLSIAVVLVIAGLVVSSSSTIVGGLLLLAVFPIVVRLLATVLDAPHSGRPPDFP
ncbi:MAG: hypothetical protein K0R87_510 [Pseudonocardia sp.]|nr:hypothetical protein [Pseudonocardia sp.]